MTTEKGTQEDHATVLPVSCLRDTVLSRHLIQTALAVPLSFFLLPSRTFYIFPFHLLHFFKTIFSRWVVHWTPTVCVVRTTLLLCFHYVGSGDSTQVFRLGREYFDLLCYPPALS